MQTPPCAPATPHPLPTSYMSMQEELASVQQYNIALEEENARLQQQIQYLITAHGSSSSRSSGHTCSSSRSSSPNSRGPSRCSSGINIPAADCSALPTGTSHHIASNTSASACWMDQAAAGVRAEGSILGRLIPSMLGEDAMRSTSRQSSSSSCLAKNQQPRHPHQQQQRQSDNSSSNSTGSRRITHCDQEAAMARAPHYEPPNTEKLRPSYRVCSGNALSAAAAQMSRGGMSGAWLQDQQEGQWGQTNQLLGQQHMQPSPTGCPAGDSQHISPEHLQWQQQQQLGVDPIAFAGVAAEHGQQLPQQQQRVQPFLAAGATAFAGAAAGQPEQRQRNGQQQQMQQQQHMLRPSPEGAAEPVAEGAAAPVRPEDLMLVLDQVQELQGRLLSVQAKLGQQQQAQLCQQSPQQKQQLVGMEASLQAAQFHQEQEHEQQDWEKGWEGGHLAALKSGGGEPQEDGTRSEEKLALPVLGQPSEQLLKPGSCNSSSSSLRKWQQQQQPGEELKQQQLGGAAVEQRGRGQAQLPASSRKGQRTRRKEVAGGNAGRRAVGSLESSQIQRGQRDGYKQERASAGQGHRPSDVPAVGQKVGLRRGEDVIRGAAVGLKVKGGRGGSLGEGRLGSLAAAAAGVRVEVAGPLMNVNHHQQQQQQHGGCLKGEVLQSLEKEALVALLREDHPQCLEQQQQQVEEQGILAAFPQQQQQVEEEEHPEQESCRDQQYKYWQQWPDQDFLVAEKMSGCVSGLGSGTGSSRPWSGEGRLREPPQQQPPSPGLYDHLLKVVTPLHNWKPGMA